MRRSLFGQLRALVLIGALPLALLTSCSPSPEPASPAFWQVTAPDGRIGWLFGTIHALERPVDWRSNAIAQAMSASGVIVVEIAAVNDDTATAREFARLAHTPGLPVLSARVPAAQRPALAKALRQANWDETRFADMETWAAALSLARAGSGALSARYGIDRALLTAAKGKRVAELEGAAGQLGLFDQLPEKEQQDLLASVLDDPDEETAGLADAWRHGRMETIARETRRGMLADPELREALFTGRNREWTQAITEMIQRDERPFVAVGAAHMAGPEGLPAMLQAKGFTVTRIQ